VVDDFATRGWARFPAEDGTRVWAAIAKRQATVAAADPAHAHMLVCEGTWFVGLDVLGNGLDGSLGEVPLAGGAVEATRSQFGWPPLHPGQVSITYPGYPRPRDGETEAGFRYRLKRDAAHVDGVLGEGSPKRRFVREPHAFIFGIGLTDAKPDAAPLVVWNGSHGIMRDAFRQAFDGLSAEEMPDHDVTAIYRAARSKCFETCQRIALPLQVGQAVLLHPMLLHGVAPWDEQAADHERMVAYFRPPHPQGITGWLSA